MANRAIGGLGEIALRVNDLDAMQEFYEHSIGLELLRRFPHAVFFRLPGGFAGHTPVLALFKRDVEVSADRTTIDHLAFTITLEDYAAEKARLEAGGLTVTTAEHDWVHWRSLYVSDPEGNTVELVCYDAAV